MHARTLSRNALATGFYLFIAILSPAILSGCAGHDATTNANTPPSTQTEARATPSPLSTPTPAVGIVAPASSPPQPSEVEAALTRVYQTAVRADARGRASALTGDFNGDASQDIAIIVKPNTAQLSEINSELANWIVADPRRVLTSSPTSRAGRAATPPPTPAQVEAGETLLAIIHGYKSEGWRNADAKQTYLLKNAIGTQMRTQTSAEARQMGKETVISNPLPFVRGDLICQVLDGKTGCLYWTGAKYDWHDQTHERRVAKTKGNHAAP